MNNCFTCDHIRDYDDYAEIVLCNIQSARVSVQHNCSFYENNNENDKK